MINGVPFHFFNLAAQRQRIYAVRTDPNGNNYLMSEAELRAWQGALYYLAPYRLVECDDFPSGMAWEDCFSGSRIEEMYL